MLIVPMENRPDWRNPPLATLLLIFINVLVFFAYQGKDPQRLEHSYRWYEESGLAARERAPFLTYLQRIDASLAQDLDDPAPARQAAWERNAQFQHAAYDPAFARALHKELDGDPAWRARRSHFDTLVNTVSARAYAFNAREARPVTWITNMFLHGSAMHLLGNMVFLFLFGFALEIAIGRATFLLLYVCSGLGGTLLYWASELGNDQSVLGASGAVSGLMGMYIALYGVKKISFFYNVIFFTGQLRAPALIMFPVWVGYELVGAYYATDRVAHWAHTGGLLFGFVLLALWMRVGLKVDRNYVEKTDADAPFKAALAQIQELVVAMKFDAARHAAAALVTAHPRAARAWRSWYGVVKISPASRDYHQVVHSLFKQSGHAARDPALQALIEEVAHDYTRIGGAAPALTESVALALAQRLGRVEHIKPLGFVVERLLVLECRHPAMPRVLQAAANLAAKAALTDPAQRYRAQLQARFPNSEEARQLAAHAPA
ncbi:rhomboid family intramembrane serine protease [Massilia sp. S19_KUP03_FR1]|uniref:rhomboid family intramembrane serine protease n=1 Tax=Massilia sp. S19_KUP03_FR1 TaxID=3025503 RepID=UPI002FCD81D3